MLLLPDESAVTNVICGAEAAVKPAGAEDEIGTIAFTTVGVIFETVPV